MSSFRRLRTVVFCLPLLAVLSAPAFSAGTNTVSPEERNAVEAAIASVKPALVRIYMAVVDYDQGREVKMEGSGSGVIVSKDGYIVTNHHVAGHSKRLIVTLANKEQVEADLVGTDPLCDIAVIKLRSDGKTDFPTAPWGDSSELSVGDRVFSMGSPYSLSQSVTMGIVSNTEMIMPEGAEGAMTMDGEDVGSMVRWIGHDAVIQPGNSGGPLVNLKGQVVGINELGIGEGGVIGGAIPSNIAKGVAQQLISSGKVSRSWMGITVQPMLKGSTVQKGALIGGIFPGSPAAAAGFKPGDILTKLAGKDVSVRFAEELPLFNQSVAALPIGQLVEAIVLRDGKETTIKVTPQQRPAAEPWPKEFKQWGMCASDISILRQREMKRSNQDGVIVQSIGPGGPSGEAKPSLEYDDVIVEVDGKPIKNVQNLISVTAEITKDKTQPTPVLVAFDRDSERLVTVVKVGTKNLEDPGREVRKAYLPIEMQVITRDIADALGIGDRTGVRVTQVYPKSAAEKAGLKVGDLIVALDGEEIPASQPEDTEVLPAMIRQYKIGSTAELTVLRNKKEVTVPVVLEESPALQREMRKYRNNDFEFTVRDLAARDRLKKNLDNDVIGVYVEETNRGGWAALGRLGTGDIIRAVDNQLVHNVDEMQAMMEKIAQNKPKHVVLTVRRGVQDLFVELETDWSK